MRKGSDHKIYYLALFCFVPVMGAFLGIGLIIIGIFKYKKILIAAIGVAMIAINVFICDRLFNNSKIQLIRSNILVVPVADQVDDIAEHLEYYQLKYGKYPDSLPQLKELDRSIVLTDPFVNRSKTYLHYEYKDSTYILFSVGEDGIPNTKDDIYPRKLLKDMK